MDWDMFKKALVAITVLTTITGCVSTKRNVCSASTRVELPMSSHPMKGSSNTKVIVFAPEMKFPTESADRVGAALSQSLSSQVHGTGSILVDRSLAGKLKTEIQIAEQSGIFSNEGVPIADIAIYTDIGLANFTREFTEARSWTSDGKSYSSPASCRFSAEVEASTKAISLPSLKTVKAIELKGDHSMSVETRDARCPISQAQAEGLLAKAAKYAVERSGELKNLLAPKGAVIEMRQCDSGTMVKVDIGKNQGVAPGWDVLFTTYEKVENVDGGYDIETRGYGEGEIINNAEHGIKPRYSWVMIDKKMAEKIKRGDTVKADFTPACDSWGIVGTLCHRTSESISNMF